MLVTERFSTNFVPDCGTSHLSTGTSTSVSLGIAIVVTRFVAMLTRISE
jgi:hypothetical protein